MGDMVGDVGGLVHLTFHLFEKAEAFKQGHFVLTSGRHSNVYFDKRAISSKPELLAKACEYLAELVGAYRIDVIVSPAEGAIPFGQGVADVLTKRLGRQIDYVTAMKDGDGFRIAKEDLDKVVRKNVAMVEDIFTTGSSTLKSAKPVTEAGGKS